MGLDLLAKRKERTGWDEAGNARTYPITAGDVKIAELGPEMPLTALEPLKEIDTELVLLFQRVLGGMTGGVSQADLSEQVMDFLVAYPDLPSKAVRIALAVGRNLFGQEGLDNFLSLDPSLQDTVALIAGISDWYGVEVGESSGSSESPPEGGTTSTTTSESTSASTPETPSASPATAA